MPSNSLRLWRTLRCQRFDEVETAHASVGGPAPGRRHAALQLNSRYALLLSAHFRGILRDVLVLNRKLDTGNPNPGNLGSDFNRFGEDRGPLGIGGHRLYGIRYSRPDSDPSYIEMPEEELEPAT